LDLALKEYRKDPRNLINENTKFHITLHLCPLGEDSKEVIFQEVNKVISGIPPIPISFESPQALSDASDSIYVAYSVISAKLFDLHNDIIEIVRKYNNGLYNLKYDDPKYGYGKRQLELLHTYGYARVKEYFHPHLSVVKVSEEAIAQKILKKLPQKLEGEFSLNRFEVIEFDDKNKIPLNIHIPINLREK
jgi:2'-5' RNA ligase